MTHSTFASLCLCAALPMACGGVVAQLTNPSFEDNGGSLDGWTVYEGSPNVGTMSDYGGRFPSHGSHLVFKTANYGPADYGFYQQITSWSADSAAAFVDVNTGGNSGVSDFCGVRIGIDPTGGTNPSSPAIVWSAVTSHRWDDTYDVASVAVDAVTPPTITVFIEAVTDPAADDYAGANRYRASHNYGSWSITAVDNVRVTPLAAMDPAQLDLGFELGTLEKWFTRNSALNVPATECWGGPFGHAIAPIHDANTWKTPQSGNYLQEYHCSGASPDYHMKKCVLLQRIAVEQELKTPTALTLTVSINRDGSTNTFDNQGWWHQFVRLGIDPTGGTDPAGSTVQWSDRRDVGGSPGTGPNTGWRQISHAYEGTYGEAATIFIENGFFWIYDINWMGLDQVQVDLTYPLDRAAVREYEFYE